MKLGLTFFRRCLELKAVFKRIDLAINDHAGLLSIPELITKCEKNECISVMASI
ncbi:replication initiation factor domain-containing protein [Paucilactobacillus hokkaidonensis]|uniref:replication initiation factor domain-containing protein n=1 Tax=Paucilactobacillus hokkaidonensis TaxID=1193095 RepID=UPI002092A7C0|nr:replication initiation factor domain-containing protein [Paucilactobacillus hokkaidonensis]